MNLTIKQEFIDHINTCQKTQKIILDDLEVASKICIRCLKNSGKILIFGNGGSAADAQHIAAELVGRYKLRRKGLPAIALTTDTSVITSISNDFGYSYIFNRQIEAIANKNDVAIGISTGGTSLNVVNALKLSNQKGCHTIGFSGKDGGEFSSICDINLVAQSHETPRIQEMHILFGHIICNLIDQSFERN
jgi:D-sedoheptulose 7-phosphate isomerase